MMIYAKVVALSACLLGIQLPAVHAFVANKAAITRGLGGTTTSELASMPTMRERRTGEYSRMSEGLWSPPWSTPSSDRYVR